MHFPTISIDQKTVNRESAFHGGTTAEILDYYRSLFARSGGAALPSAGKRSAQTRIRLVDNLCAMSEAGVCSSYRPTAGTHENGKESVDLAQKHFPAWMGALYRIQGGPGARPVRY